MVSSILQKGVSTSNEQDLCSLEVREDGIAFAHISSINSSQPELKACGYRHYDNLGKFEQILASIVIDYNLKDINCNLVLNPKFYRLLLVNSPEVSYTEYRSAVRWQIKDMVDIALEDVSVEIFAPVGLPESEAKKLYVIAAQTSFLQDKINILRRNTLTPVSIDITEFAVRNILNYVADKEPLLFLQIEANNTLLIVVENRSVYFVRRISMGLVAAKSNPNTNVLGIEIQRSLDYYSIELRQKIPEKIVIAPSFGGDNTVHHEILDSLGKEIQYLNLNNIVTYFEPLSNELQAHCFVAIGGALRERGGK